MNATEGEALAELIEFAAAGGWRWSEPLGSVFSFVTGDPDDVCTREDGTYVIRKHERGMISKPLIVADDLGDIEKYLSFRYGHTVRRKSGLPDIRLTEVQPVEIGAEHSDYSVSGTPANMLVSWTDSSGRHEVSLDYLSASKWVCYSRFSAREIRNSFLQPEGIPLFALPPDATQH